MKSRDNSRGSRAGNRTDWETNLYTVYVPLVFAWLQVPNNLVALVLAKYDDIRKQMMGGCLLTKMPIKTQVPAQIWRHKNQMNIFLKDIVLYLQMYSDMINRRT